MFEWSTLAHAHKRQSSQSDSAAHVVCDEWVGGGVLYVADGEGVVQDFRPIPDARWGSDHLAIGVTVLI